MVLKLFCRGGFWSYFFQAMDVFLQVLEGIGFADILILVRGGYFGFLIFVCQVINLRCYFICDRLLSGFAREVEVRECGGFQLELIRQVCSDGSIEGVGMLFLVVCEIQRVKKKKQCFRSWGRQEGGFVEFYGGQRVGDEGWFDSLIGIGIKIKQIRSWVLGDGKAWGLDFYCMIFRGSLVLFWVVLVFVGVRGTCLWGRFQKDFLQGLFGRYSSVQRVRQFLCIIWRIIENVGLGVVRLQVDLGKIRWRESSLRRVSIG